MIKSPTIPTLRIFRAGAGPAVATTATRSLSAVVGGLYAKLNRLRQQSRQQPRRDGKLAGELVQAQRR